MKPRRLISLLLLAASLLVLAWGISAARQPGGHVTLGGAFVAFLVLASIASALSRR